MTHAGQRQGALTVGCTPRFGRGTALLRARNSPMMGVSVPHKKCKTKPRRSEGNVWMLGRRKEKLDSDPSS
eukprot:841163-Rhodomonas_salina.1